MKILVTGGAGFIGSHVSEACILAGHDVVVLDDLSMGTRENVHPRATFVRMDIRDGAIGKVFSEGRFDAVIHHAAQMDVRTSVDDPGFDASVNILGTINILEHCKATGVRNFLFASTGGAIYGEQDYFPADEGHPVRPVSPYGISKLAVENYLFYYNVEFGVRYVCLRYANVYGPRQNPNGEAGVVAIFTKKLLAGEQPIINGEGRQTRDYVYVDDVVRANMFALRSEQSAIFNVGTGIETDVNHLFAALNRLVGATRKEVYGPAKKGEQERSVLDCSKIGKAFDWKPTVSLEEGLRRTVEFFRQRMKK